MKVLQIEKEWENSLGYPNRLKGPCDYPGDSRKYWLSHLALWFEKGKLVPKLTDSIIKENPKAKKAKMMNSLPDKIPDNKEHRQTYKNICKRKSWVSKMQPHKPEQKNDSSKQKFKAFLEHDSYCIAPQDPPNTRR